MFAVLVVGPQNISDLDTQDRDGGYVARRALEERLTRLFDNGWTPADVTILLLDHRGVGGAIKGIGRALDVAVDVVQPEEYTREGFAARDARVMEEMKPNVVVAFRGHNGYVDYNARRIVDTAYDMNIPVDFPDSRTLRGQYKEAAPQEPIEPPFEADEPAEQDA